ncbi:hypothetical protein DIPPA_15507 [Diplonema papillatum]|nr:hypothetical protein DIPPA_15507 [Diplonema papillatum]
MQRPAWGGPQAAGGQMASRAASMPHVNPSGGPQCVTRVLSPRANHPALNPQLLCGGGDNAQANLRGLDMDALANMHPPPPGLPAHVRHVAMDSAEPMVYNMGDGTSTRVAFSWSADGRMRSQWDEATVGQPSRDSANLLMKRIVETREELGRLQRENDALEKQLASKGIRTDTVTGDATKNAHEGRPLWSDNVGSVGAYSWDTAGPQHRSTGGFEPEWAPRFAGHVGLAARWPERDRELLRELEYTHAKLESERRRKSRYEHIMSRGSFALLGGGEELGLDPAGWDQYVASDTHEVVIPAVFLLELAPDFDYNTWVRTERGVVSSFEKRFMAAAARDLSEMFRQPAHHTLVRHVEIITHDAVRLHTAFEVNRVEVLTVRSHLANTLASMPKETFLLSAGRVLKETGRPVRCELVHGKSWIGSSRIEGKMEGYGTPVASTVNMVSGLIKLRLATDYKDFSKSRFKLDVAEAMGLQVEQVEIMGVEEGSTIVTFRFTKLPDADAVAERFIARCGRSDDDIHRVLGPILSAEHKGLPLVQGGVKGADLPPPTTTTKAKGSRRRRRRGDTSSSDNSGRSSDSSKSAGNRRKSSSADRRRQPSAKAPPGNFVSQPGSRPADDTTVKAPVQQHRRRRRREADGSPPPSGTASPERRRRRAKSGDGTSRRRRRDVGASSSAYSTYDEPTEYSETRSRRRRRDEDAATGYPPAPSPRSRRRQTQDLAAPPARLATTRPSEAPLKVPASRAQQQFTYVR